jgi:TrmH family RNA methyltransferase
VELEKKRHVLLKTRMIESRQNPRLKELRRLLATPGRELAAVEGPNLVEEAVRAGLRLQTVFATPEAESFLAGLGLSAETEILLVPRALLQQALVTESPQPIAAVVELPSWSWESLLSAKPPLIVLLAGLQDPGNLGTILRSAEAFGASGVITLPGTVSAWNPKAVRASAGSVLRLPVLQAEVDVAFRKLRQAGVKVWTTAVREASPVQSAELSGPVAIVIGNEGNGVPEEVAAEADAALTIRCPGPVESLNAAIAASILLYEAASQRAGKGSRR